jgi:hypothetical protein
MTYIKKKGHTCNLIARPHNSFLLHMIPVVTCLVMPPVTRSKNAILCPGLGLLAKKGQSIPEKCKKMLTRTSQ